MNARDINATFDLLALVEQHTTLKRAGHYWAGPCPFCGGRDRFEIKQANEGGFIWHCRKCAEGKYHSAIDYVMRYGSLDFKAALTTMGGEVGKPSSALAKRVFKPATLPPLPNSDWQISMLERVSRAAECLNTSPAGAPGREYLAGRGLHQGTWAIYSLGYSAAVNDPKLKEKGLPHTRPAIIVPWLDNDGLLTCINSRFIDDQPEGLNKYKATWGSKRTLFGLNAIWYSPALVVCEGEFNCCSIHQANAAAGGLGLAVVSIGGEDPSELTLALLKALVQKYQRVFCWIDEPERSQAVVAALGKTAQALHSPDRDGVKLDANAMLQAGILPDFLRAMLAA